MNDLRALRATRQPILNAWLNIPDPLVAEVMARQGFHSVVIDMQHGMIDFSHLVSVLQAVELTTACPLIRVADNDPAQVARALDAGAMGVIVPLVNSREEAVRAVAACRYPPAGVRSYGPTRAALAHGADYQERANDEVLVFAMIETRDGLENVEEIASTPGLDGIYIGPSDLGLALGLSPQPDNEHPEHRAAVSRIVEACRVHHLIAGLHCASTEFAKSALAQGVDLVTIATDLKCLQLEAARRLEFFG